MFLGFPFGNFKLMQLKKYTFGIKKETFGIRIILETPDFRTYAKNFDITNASFENKAEIRKARITFNNTEIETDFRVQKNHTRK